MEQYSGSCDRSCDKSYVEDGTLTRSVFNHNQLESFDGKGTA